MAAIPNDRLQRTGKTAPAAERQVVSQPRTSAPRRHLRKVEGRWPGPVTRDPGRMRTMPKPLTADDVLPVVACLTPQERVRLLRLITSPPGADAPVYRSVPPARDEFSTDEEPLAWDAEGWEDVG